MRISTKESLHAHRGSLTQRTFKKYREGKIRYKRLEEWRLKHLSYASCLLMVVFYHFYNFLLQNCFDVDVPTIYHFAA